MGNCGLEDPTFSTVILPFEDHKIQTVRLIVTPDSVKAKRERSIPRANSEMFEIIRGFGWYPCGMDHQTSP